MREKGEISDAQRTARASFVKQFRESRYRPTFEEIGLCIGFLSRARAGQIYRRGCRDAGEQPQRILGDTTRTMARA